MSFGLSVNGFSVSPVIGNSGYPGTEDYFASAVPGGPTLFDLRINTANISNLTYLDFPGATGGTATVLSETFGTPLPAALPLFGSGLIALAGFAR